jgi:hypothetical protein
MHATVLRAPYVPLHVRLFTKSHPSKSYCVICEIITMVVLLFSDFQLLSLSCLELNSITAERQEINAETSYVTISWEDDPKLF